MKKQIIFFGVVFFSIIWFLQPSLIYISDKLQKQICVSEYCVSNIKGWLPIVKRDEGVYLFDIIPITYIISSSDILEDYENGIVFIDGKNTIDIHQSDKENNFDERWMSKYHLNNKTYFYMKKFESSDGLSTSIDIIYPNMNLTYKISTCNNSDAQTLVHDLILGSNYKIGVNNVSETEIDNTLKAAKEYKLALMYYRKAKSNKDYYKKAFELLNNSAKLGNIKALFLLGLSHHNGEYVKQNYSKARFLYAKPVYYEMENAQYNLGVLYYKGQGVAKNYKKAFNLFEKAAQQGQLDALNHLGIMYLYGLGVEINKEKAYNYWIKSKNGGNKFAIDNLNDFCKNNLNICQK